MRKLLAIVALLAVAPQAWAFPAAADYSSQPLGKVNFTAFDPVGFANGWVHEFRTSGDYAFVSKQAVLFLRGTIAFELGGIGNLNGAAFGIGPAVNFSGLFSLIPVFKKLPIFKPLVAGGFFGWSPDGIAVKDTSGAVKDVAHFVYGTRIGLQWRW